MSLAPNLRPIDIDEVFTYPIPVGVRLESHSWFQFHHAWWRDSDFRRDADREVRAVFFDLLCGSQDQNPVGTLPTADKDLAWIARVTLEDWQRLMQRPITPLYGWKRCSCSNGQIRLYHPTLLKVTRAAAKSHTDAEERRAADRERKRLKELPEKVIRAGGSRRLSEDPAYILRLDQYLVEHIDEGKSRTVRSVRMAMEAMELSSH